MDHAETWAQRGGLSGFNELMEDIRHLEAIDGMDRLGFLRLRVWDASLARTQKGPGSASVMKADRG